MNPTQNATSESIRNLAEASGPCVTIVLAGGQQADAELQLKDALQKLREKCEGRRIDPEPLLGPIPPAVREFQRTGKAREPIAIFRSPSVTLTVKASSAAKPVALLGNHFDLRTLLAIAGAQITFYIIGLSQNRTRLLKCTQDRSEEVPLEGAAVSLREAMQTRAPDHVLDNRSSAGPSSGSGQGVMFGTSSDADDQDQYLLHFFAGIDQAVNKALRGSRDPLIPAGVEHEIALYARVNTYPNLFEPGIHGAPDGLEGGEMHRRGLQLVSERASEPGWEVPADFDKKVGTGRASTRIQEIVSAAYQGRVSQLYMQENASYMGVFDPVRQIVKHTLDPLDEPEELIESAAYETIRHGGEARVLPSSAMPNGVPVCAIFRYAVASAAEPPAEPAA